jgi:hypothetical protein
MVGLFLLFIVVFLFMDEDTDVIGVRVVAISFDLMVFECDEERIGRLTLNGGESPLINESDNADDDE